MCLRDYFIKIYGKECVELLIESNSLEIKRDKDQLNEKLANYTRYKKFKENLFLIEGCTDCLKYNVKVLQQDFPGWEGPLKSKDIIVLGLEISPKQKNDIHIAYNLGNIIETADKSLYEKIGAIINNFKQRAYVTDIAKCYSTNIKISRRNCITNLTEELNLVIKNSAVKKMTIIIQGYGTQEIIEKEFRNISIEDNFEYYPLIRKGTIKFADMKFPLFVFPHTSRAKGSTKKWEEIFKKLQELKVYFNNQIN